MAAWLRGCTVVGVGIRGEGRGVGEPGAWGEITAGLRVSRPVLVARLMEFDAVGALTTAHVRAGAQVGGVTARTVWRWLDAARTEGRVERRPRARLEVSDQAWEVLAQAGGNVSVLYRYLKDAGGQVPSLASLHRVVRRDLQAGRALPDRVVVRREREEEQTRQALADLALARPGEGDAAKVAARRPPHLASAAVAGTSAGESGALEGVALPAGAQLVRTSPVRAVAEAVGQAMAVQGAVCVFGDPGRGKTVAVRMALHEVPPGWKVTWVPVPVRPSVAGMRRAVFDALALPGRFPHTSARADTAVARALDQARVLVVDEAQRLPAPCLEYLQSLWDHPGTRITLVLCGAGSERALARLPQLASRIGVWQEVPRLTGAEAAAVMTGFHPLWRTVPAPDLTWIDQSCAHGTLRTWAALTAHLQNALLTSADAAVDRALLRRLFQRVVPPL
ncbi:ATP-binding protein [Streptomyces purpurogeneiscleroticus]|uniref:ATP-binding protein n=1 Tax=Streptomyces purpurogeneiscleroticus TaxID=68259 RepID=UPI001CBD68BD|nr:ATP-binding protein [Streptomyces purpurogeneiscleroticus]